MSTAFNWPHSPVSNPVSDWNLSPVKDEFCRRIFLNKHLDRKMWKKLGYPAKKVMRSGRNRRLRVPTFIIFRFLYNFRKKYSFNCETPHFFAKYSFYSGFAILGSYCLNWPVTIKSIQGVSITQNGAKIANAKRTFRGRRYHTTNSSIVIGKFKLCEPKFRTLVWSKCLIRLRNAVAVTHI